VLYQGGQVPVFEQEPVIVGALENASAAKAAGVQVGDHIVSVDGVDVDTWEQFYTAVAGKAKRELSLGVERPGSASMSAWLRPRKVSTRSATSVCDRSGTRKSSRSIQSHRRRRRD